ncbi:hypothetical protein AVEN_192888-1 [Araneus ventricosus]|uniref:Uncharacterized protein n=1 Tax=Araneus ventricosus TaxID=182803 RepID=A0A4Y2QE20_ARAVE|nr:hypothetical protein AVEN_192888-1 [Araneus ventricosus]
MSPGRRPRAELNITAMPSSEQRHRGGWVSKRTVYGQECFYMRQLNFRLVFDFRRLFQGYRHGKLLPSNAGLMVGKRVLQGEAWSDLSDSRGTHDLGDKLGDHFGDLGDK